MIRRARLAAAAAAAIALPGCVTLLPKSPPAQLYRFEVSAPSAPSAARPLMAVRLARVDFPPAAGGDQILTVHGVEVAYIAGARWAASATDLFEATVQQGFDATGGAVRLAGWGVGDATARRLRLDVIRFEARYQPGQAAPTIVVRLRAELESATSGAAPSARIFEADVPASADRVSAIVDAFDAATSKVVRDLVTWVVQSGEGGPPRG